MFNPVGERMDFTAALPMRYAELPGGSTVLVEGKRLVLDSNSNVSVHTALEPYEVKAVPIERG